MSDRVRADVAFMIYGSYGVTGSLIVREALRRGHRPLLAGRDAGKLAAQAEPLGLRWAAVDLGDRAGIERALREVSAVLLVAGPFATTGRAMVEACIATGTSYVDTNGELEFFEVAGAGPRAQRLRRATARSPRRARSAPTTSSKSRACVAATCPEPIGAPTGHRRRRGSAPASAGRSSRDAALAPAGRGTTRRPRGPTA
ncbi:MAG: hypothetical protein EPO40_35600 [Myxococcaceae bacterium]|nr:MAG: hypothetical protein EPO40_35600 [Myxococcaceae bacterium]